MNLLLPLLPAKVRPYAKAVLAALGTVLTAVALVVPNDPAWVTVVLSALTALGVYVQPNGASKASVVATVTNVVDKAITDAASQVPALAPVIPLVVPEVAKITTTLTGTTDPTAVPAVGIVGENGPELVNLPPGSTVTPAPVPPKPAA